MSRSMAVVCFFFFFLCKCHCIVSWRIGLFMHVCCLNFNKVSVSVNFNLSWSCYIEEWKHTRNNRTRTTWCSRRRKYQLTENCWSVGQPKEISGRRLSNIATNILWYEWQCSLICDRDLFAVFITCSFNYMLFPVRALSVSTLPSVAITRPLQSSYCYMPFPLHVHSIRLALPA